MSDYKFQLQRKNGQNGEISIWQLLGDGSEFQYIKIEKSTGKVYVSIDGKHYTESTI